MTDHSVRKASGVNQKHAMQKATGERASRSDHDGTSLLARLVSREISYARRQDHVARVAKTADTASEPLSDAVIDAIHDRMRGFMAVV